jgi:hypothetical protein
MLLKQLIRYTCRFGPVRSDHSIVSIYHNPPPLNRESPLGSRERSNHSIFGGRPQSEITGLSRDLTPSANEGDENITSCPVFKYYVYSIEFRCDRLHKVRYCRISFWPGQKKYVLTIAMQAPLSISENHFRDTHCAPELKQIYLPSQMCDIQRSQFKRRIAPIFHASYFGVKEGSGWRSPGMIREYLMGR